MQSGLQLLLCAERQAVGCIVLGRPGDDCAGCGGAVGFGGVCAIWWRAIVASQRAGLRRKGESSWKQSASADQWFADRRRECETYCSRGGRGEDQPGRQ